MNTKIIIYILVGVVIIIGGLYVFSSYQNAPVSITSPDTSLATTVTIANFSFNPSTLTVNKGETVFWTNNDSVPHQIAGTGFDGPVMSNGQSFAFTFTTAGTFNYHCAIHPSMQGTIVVN